MASNLILPFAQGAGANVLSDAGYAASDVLAQGFQQGRAASAKYNKALRQSTAVSSGFGQFTADWSALDFTDSLSPQVMRDNFRIALAAALDGARYGVDTGSAANSLVVTLTPKPPTLNSFTALYVKVANTNNGPALLNLNGYGLKSIVLPDGTQLVGGEMVQGRIYSLLFDGTQFQLQNAFQNLTTVINNTYAKGSLIARRVFSTVGTQTYTPSAGTNRVRVTVVGGGAAGAGTPATGGGQFATGGGGGAGGVAVTDLSSGFANVTLTVGAGGSPVNGGSAAGGSGATSSFGAFCAGTGGAGGSTNSAVSSAAVQAGGLGGFGSGGNIFNGVGGPGANGVGTSAGNVASGAGGPSYFGAGAGQNSTGTPGNGQAATTPGAGGGGAVAVAGSSAYSGGAGAPGQIIIEEYA
jgi:hypothetical protein